MAKPKFKIGDMVNVSMPALNTDIFGCEIVMFAFIATDCGAKKFKYFVHRPGGVMWAPEHRLTRTTMLSKKQLLKQVPWSKCVWQPAGLKSQ